MSNPKSFDWRMTLQETVFVRLLHLTYPAWMQAAVTKGIGVREGLSARMEEVRQDPEQKQRFSSIDIHLPSLAGPTLHPALQDLANIIAYEADQAFYGDYYPRLPDVDFPEDRVDALMEAMQREMDREATRRKLEPVRLAELTWGRKCALAERRRYWYGQFGITPESWQTGKWSLWGVSAEILFPEEVKERFRWS